jgi:transglutaminase-like putative cysteine protease
MKLERLGLNSLLLTAVLAFATHVQNLPLWLTLAFIGALMWRFAIHSYGWPAPHRLLRLSLTVVVVAATVAHFGTVLGRDAGGALLAALLALKLLELRRPRDALVAVLLCYLLLLTGFLYEQSIWLAAYSVLVVWLSIVTLILINQPTLTSMRYSLRLATVVLAKALPLTLAMFLLFPRVEGNLWGLPTTMGSAITGLSDVMQPGSVHRLIVSDAPAFRVEFEGEPPKPAQLYWRALVLWQTDGQRWLRGDSPLLPSAAAPAQFAYHGAPLKYRVTLEANDRSWLPALDLPILAPPRSRPRWGYVYEYRRPVRARLSYTLASYLRYHTGPLSRAERRLALQLPDKLSPRVRALAQSWRAGADDLAVAQAALAYFRREPFFYTLNPPPLGADPVDEFLFSTRRGFCGHFAAAFVTLMRAAGVPSRIVEGYLGGEYNPAGKYWIVRQSDAHAWAEIWLPQQGWLRVDPTAAVAPERVELGIDAVRQLELSGVRLGQLPAEALRKLIALGIIAQSWRTLRLYWDATNLAWHSWVLSYDRQRQQSLLTSLHLPALSWRGLLLTLTLALLCGLLALAAFTRRARPTDAAQALYRRYCNKLARIGLARTPTEGPLSFARRSAAARPDLKAEVDAVTELYIGLRYTRDCGAEHLRALRQRVARFQPQRAPPTLLSDTKAREDARQ